MVTWAGGNEKRTIYCDLAAAPRAVTGGQSSPGTGPGLELMFTPVAARKKWNKLLCI